jgi:hypothetical protein
MIRRRRKYQMGGYNQQEQQVESGVSAGIGVVGAINPVIGAGLSIGKGIGQASRDQDGLYKGKFGEFAANSFDPVTGVQNLVDLKNNFTMSGALNQASLGLLGKSATQERREKEKFLRERKATNSMMESMNAQNITAGYDFLGNKGQGAIYAQMGGNVPQTPVPGGILKQLNSDTVEVNGATHEQGGVQIPGAEVEDNETITGDYVFSDYLGFAEKHKSLAKQIGKIEQKPINRERRVSLEILRKKEAAMRQQQEQLKEALGVADQQSMQMGGYVQPYGGWRSQSKQYLSGPFADERNLTEFLKGRAYTEPEGMPANPQNTPGILALTKQINNKFAGKEVGRLSDQLRDRTGPMFEAQRKNDRLKLYGLR